MTSARAVYFIRRCRWVLGPRASIQLTRYDERGWRAAFYTTGMEHSPTSATGTGWERTPWHATLRAAGEALKKPEGGRE
jgi:hypothetical protein